MIGFLGFLHQRFAFALLLLALVLALWGTYQYIRHRAVSGGFRSTYLMLIGLTAVQGLAGATLFGVGTRPHVLLHIVYGIFAVAFLPGLYFYSRGGGRDREAVLLAAGCWIVLVAYGRGFMTGQ